MSDVTTEKNETDDTQWSIMPAISSAELGLPPLDHDQVWMDSDGRIMNVPDLHFGLDRSATISPLDRSLLNLLTG